MHARYKRMLKVMQENEEAVAIKPEEWFVYILRCSDGTLYTGMTNDLERRVKMHNEGKASRYTRSRKPVRLIYQESCLSRTQALVRECAIKSLPRKRKEKLFNP